MTNPSSPVFVEIVQDIPETITIIQTPPANFGLSLTGPQGPAGPEGPPGAGIIPGGDTGQSLVKASSTDYDVEWGNAQPTGSVLSYASNLTTLSATTGIVSGGKFQTEEGVAGNHEYKVVDGPVTISAGYAATDWFSMTEDTVSSWIVVKGALTIGAGVVFSPPVRKLFTVIYVDGDLTLDGEISMTARGANHSGYGNSGGMTKPVDILVKDGMWIAAYGGMGGSGIRSNSHPGIPGQPGIGISSGGGGGGGTGLSISYGNSTSGGGAGAAGTCFSGGPGGGGQPAAPMDVASGVAWGGAGGKVTSTWSGSKGGNGAGNPSPPTDTNGNGGTSGTGGTLIVIVTGSITGAGSLTAKGSPGGNLSGTAGSPSGGGGSGGGIIVTLIGGTGSPTVNVTGGLGGSSSNSQSGGAGGTGSVRITSI